MIERYKIAEIGIDGCDSAEEDHAGEWVLFNDHQAELDRVMGEAVRFAERLKTGFPITRRLKAEAENFLDSPEVRAWRERQCDHQWGTDGQHSNEFCKKCFVNKERQKEHS